MCRFTMIYHDLPIYTVYKDHHNMFMVVFYNHVGFPETKWIINHYITRDNRGISPNPSKQSRKVQVHEKDWKGYQQIWEGPIDSYTVVQKWCMENLEGIAWRKMMHAHRYDIILKGGIAIWEGPIACVMLYNFWKPMSVPYDAWEGAPNWWQFRGEHCFYKFSPENKKYLKKVMFYICWQSM